MVSQAAGAIEALPRRAALSRVLAQGIAGNLCQGALFTRNRTTRLRSVRGDLRCRGVAAPCNRQRRCEAAVILKEHLHRKVRLAFAEAHVRETKNRQRDQRVRMFLTADQHRRLAALLRRGTAPGRDEQVAHHERARRSDRTGERYQQYCLSVLQQQYTPRSRRNSLNPSRLVKGLGKAYAGRNGATRKAPRLLVR